MKKISMTIALTAFIASTVSTLAVSPRPIPKCGARTHQKSLEKASPARKCGPIMRMRSPGVLANHVVQAHTNKVLVDIGITHFYVQSVREITKSDASEKTPNCVMNNEKALAFFELTRSNGHAPITYVQRGLGKETLVACLN